MDKEKLLEELSKKINTGEINHDEILNRPNSAPPTNSQTNNEETKNSSHFSLTKMLYISGAAIVIIGIFTFISQIWNDIGPFGHIVVTLGLGLLTAAIGSILLKQKPQDNIGAIFHFIGGMLIPFGAMITLRELAINFVSLWLITLTSGTIFTFYLLLNAIHKHPVLTFFAIANGTGFIYLLSETFLEGSPYLYNNFYTYLTMAIGISYLLLAHAFRNGWNKKLLGALYFFGSGGFLSAAFSQVFDSISWQSLYFFIVLGGLFLSIYMKSRIILIMSTFFLVVHISYITGKYFANSLGWPISLVILGLVFIGLGYISIAINKRYIKKSN